MALRQDDDAGSQSDGPGDCRGKCQGDRWVEDGIRRLHRRWRDTWIRQHDVLAAPHRLQPGGLGLASHTRQDPRIQASPLVNVEQTELQPEWPPSHGRPLSETTGMRQRYYGVRCARWPSRATPTQPSGSPKRLSKGLPREPSSALNNWSWWLGYCRFRLGTRSAFWTSERGQARRRARF